MSIEICSFCSPLCTVSLLTGKSDDVAAKYNNKNTKFLSAINDKFQLKKKYIKYSKYLHLYPCFQHTLKALIRENVKKKTISLLNIVCAAIHEQCVQQQQKILLNFLYLKLIILFFFVICFTILFF